MHYWTKLLVWKASIRNLVNKSESSNLRGNPAAISAPVTTCHKDFNPALVDKEEDINKTNRVNVLHSKISASTNRHSALLTNSKTIQEIHQVHQCGPTIMLL